MKLNKNSKAVILIIPFVIAGGLIFFNISNFGVNTPHGDEWEMVPIFQKIDNHTISFSDFWQQHNEHRIFFPNLVLTLSAYITHWNVKAELFINFAFSIVTALMLYLFVLTRIKHFPLALLTAALIAVWFYSPIQYENWTWGWQVEWFMCIAGCVSSIYLIDKFSLCKAKQKWRYLYFSGAILAAIFATFSLGGGQFIWIVGLFILLAYRKNLRSIVSWIMPAILSFVVYYYHYHKPNNSPPVITFVHQPLHFFQYILIYFGGPIVDNQSGPFNPRETVLLGSLLLMLLIPLLYAVWLKRKSLSKFIPWLSLILLSIMAGLATAVSRLGFGVNEAAHSRYTAFSLLYIIGISGLVFALIDVNKLKTQKSAQIILITLAISLPLLFSSYQNGIKGFHQTSNYLKSLRLCIHSSRVAAICLKKTYRPSVNIARVRLNYIKQKHWSDF